MPSLALDIWNTRRVARLDELEAVHARLTGKAPGRQWFTEQLDRAYVVALASQFQGYCRDLHSEAAKAIAGEAPVSVRRVFESSLILGRHLDRGNATAGNIGADFERLGFSFWDAVYKLDGRNKDRRERLDQVIVWRNAIAHDSPVPATQERLIAGTKPTMTHGRRWRRALAALAQQFDRAAADGVQVVVGDRPW